MAEPESRDTTAPGPPEPDKQIVGGFEIISKLGKGGMGAVFKARQISADRIVALKILPPRLARNKTFTERFLREARSAAKLNHPHIVQAITAGQDGAYYYFAMECVSGPTVARMLKAKGVLPERRALEIARDVARALDCAHEAGLVHRDVKPDNILVDADGAAKLADLGLAREIEVTDADLTQPGVAVGTPNYISPEQIRGEHGIDGRSDIYSLGATLYHMLVGQAPYAGGSSNEVMAKHLAEPVPDARKANPDVSPLAAAIVRKAMAKEAARRYPAAGAMLDSLQAAIAAPQRPAIRPAARKPVPRKPTPTGDTAVSPAVRRRRRSPVPWIIAGAVAAALLIFVIVAAKLAEPRKPGQPGGKTGTRDTQAPAPGGKTGTRDTQTPAPGGKTDTRNGRAHSRPPAADRTPASTFLSDVDPELATVGWATLGRNVVPREMNRTGVCRKAGKTYEKFIVAHAPSRLVYRLPENAARLTAAVGLTDSSGGHGSAVFKVLGDGRELFRSEVLSGRSNLVAVDVGLKGVRKLELIVGDAGNGNDLDHSAWFEPKLWTAGEPGR
ncbi:MAG: protein kinase [Planctomycetota bacterium]